MREPLVAAQQDYHIAFCLISLGKAEQATECSHYDLHVVQIFCLVSHGQ